jgi:hypothetical protein
MAGLLIFTHFPLDLKKNISLHSCFSKKKPVSTGYFENQWAQVAKLADAPS